MVKEKANDFEIDEESWELSEFTRRKRQVKWLVREAVCEFVRCIYGAPHDASDNEDVEHQSRQINQNL